MSTFIRKSNRLKNYDYSRPGMYFITVCTKDRKNFFWKSLKQPETRDDIKLSYAGNLLRKTVEEIENIYPVCKVRYFTIMPNHFHMILQIFPDEFGHRVECASVGTVVAQLKGTVTKRLGQAVFQKSFHDHIIRDRSELEKISNYIRLNPLCWKNDCFFISE